MNNSSLELIKKLIEKYKKLIFTDKYDELYKWEALKNFQDNWNIEDANFELMFDKSFQPKNCNLWAARRSLPREMMTIFIEKDMEKVREMFHNLFNESLVLEDRIKSFIDESKKLTDEVFTLKDKNSYQDARIIMLYLSFRYPEKYYLYKHTMYKDFLNITKISEFPKRSDIVSEYLKMCNEVKNILEKDNELISLHKKRIASKEYYKDDSNNLLTQDFIYCVTKHLNLAKNDQTEVGILPDKKSNDDFSSLNQILFGPPGTGKTYRTKEIAISIINSQSEDMDK